MENSSLKALIHRLFPFIMRPAVSSQNETLCQCMGGLFGPYDSQLAQIVRNLDDKSGCLQPKCGTSRLSGNKAELLCSQ
ncbi:hypothetical protein D3C75_1204750 [compost metagenome]